MKCKTQCSVQLVRWMNENKGNVCLKVTAEGYIVLEEWTEKETVNKGYQVLCSKEKLTFGYLMRKYFNIVNN